MAPLYQRRTGPRRVTIETAVQPWSRWDPVLPGAEMLPPRNAFVAQQGAVPGLCLRRTKPSPSRRSRSSRSGSSGKNHVHCASPRSISRGSRNTIRSCDASSRSRVICARAGKTGRHGNRRGKVSRTAARHSVGVEGSARHGGHRHDLWRRTIPQSRSEVDATVVTAAARAGRGAHRQAEARRARAERHLVRRTDDESVAARGRRVRIERRARAQQRRRG